MCPAADSFHWNLLLCFSTTLKGTWLCHSNIGHSSSIIDCVRLRCRHNVDLIVDDDYRFEAVDFDQLIHGCELEDNWRSWYFWKRLVDFSVLQFHEFNTLKRISVYLREMCPVIKSWMVVVSSVSSEPRSEWLVAETRYLRRRSGTRDFFNVNLNRRLESRHIFDSDRGIFEQMLQSEGKFRVIMQPLRCCQRCNRVSIFFLTLNLNKLSHDVSELKFFYGMVNNLLEYNFTNFLIIFITVRPMNRSEEVVHLRFLCF